MKIVSLLLIILMRNIFFGCFKFFILILHAATYQQHIHHQSLDELCWGSHLRRGEINSYSDSLESSK